MMETKAIQRFYVRLMKWDDWHRYSRKQLTTWSAPWLFAAVSSSVLTRNITALRPMVVIRSRSRNTYGFDAPRYDLPLLELEALLPRGVKFTQVDDSLFWVDGPNDGLIANAASRAILTQASFDMINGSAFELTDVPEFLHASGENLPIGPETQVVDMQNPNLSRVQRLDILEQAGGTKNNGAAPDEPRPTVLLRRQDGHVHIGYRTATGSAASLGAPGKSSSRRNFKGVLGTFALKARLHLTHTAMEPEMAFLMSNLANVSSSAPRVLDPCCGSASLLLTSAYLGASHLVGVDRDRTAFEGAQLDFQQHKLPVPLFYEGDVLKPLETAVFAESFDAVVCDPPYNIGAPILVNGQDDRPSSYHDDESDIHDTSSRIANPPDLSAAILSIARSVLVVGGRLVFLLPVRGEEATFPLKQVLQKCGWPQNGETLEIFSGRLQRFSPTFSRWLVCMERER